MLVVVALDGDISDRPEDVARAVRAIAEEHTVVVTQGNGSHSSLLARRRRSGLSVLPSAADVNARILEQALRDGMPNRMVACQGADVIVRLVPFGPHHPDTAESRASLTALGWMLTQDPKGLRRCIPTPEPQRIFQLEAIEAQIEAGALLLCPFGAGISTTEATELGPRYGEARIDANLAAALLAERLGADLLILLGRTDVARMEVDWPRGPAAPLGASTNDVLREISSGPGLMGPRAEAACRFVEATGKRAAVGALAHAREIVQGDRGVQVTAKPAGPVAAGSAGSSVTVLVADDNNVATRLCQLVLERARYRVLTASDGLGAVWLALAESPDMILLDCAMPGMTSLEAMRMIRKQKSSVPIVILTVDHSTWNRSKFLAAGAAEVLCTPMKLTDLIEVAARFTVNRQVQQPPWWG